MKHWIFLILLLLANGAHAEEYILGSATYRERVALAPDAVFEVVLEDISRADAKAEVLGQVRLDSPGQVPIYFEIPYDAGQIVETHMYGVRAKIRTGDRLLFVTEQVYPVLTRGNGNQISLLLKRVAQRQSDSDLEAKDIDKVKGKTWMLAQIGEQEIVGDDKAQRPFIVFQAEGTSVSGFAGCNRFMGGYESDGEKLKFGNLGSTMMACVEGMDLEQAFYQALSGVCKWGLVKNRLEFYDNERNLMMQFTSEEKREN